MHVWQPWVASDLLASLGECHPGKGRGEGFRVHLTACALQVIILPRLSVRRLKHQPTTWPHVIITRSYRENERKIENQRDRDKGRVDGFFFFIRLQHCSTWLRVGHVYIRMDTRIDT